MSLAVDQARAREHRQMRGHGVLRNLDQTGQFAGGNAFRLTLDEQPERIEAGRLSERGQGGNDF
jgi:hypothetical protein